MDEITTAQREAIMHAERTGHGLHYSEDTDLWNCMDCSWVDSNFVPVTELGDES